MVKRDIAEKGIRDSYMIKDMLALSRELYQIALEDHRDEFVYEARAFYTNVRCYWLDDELININDLGDDYRALDYKICEAGYSLNIRYSERLKEINDLFTRIHFKGDED